MIEQDISRKLWYLLTFVVGVIVVFSLNFLLQNMQAFYFYEKVKNANLDNLPKEEKISFYKKIFKNLDAAISLSRFDANLYSKKADFLWKAKGDNLKDELLLHKTDIEDFYKRAINLNPLNYQFHLKLGWFYFTQRELDLAEKYLVNAWKLYPTDYQVYLYLIKYYFKVKKEQDGFIKLLHFLYYAKQNTYQLLSDLKNDLDNLSFVTVDWQKRQLKFYFLDVVYLDLKEQNFPHFKLPITIRIYTSKKNQFQQIELSRNYDVYAYFNQTDNGIYQIDVSENLDRFYLDEISIKAKPTAVLDKVEISFEF